MGHQQGFSDFTRINLARFAWDHYSDESGMGRSLRNTQEGELW
jgi:hypothetical protein